VLASTALAAASVSSSAPSFVPAFFSAPAQVVAGTAYAIVISAPEETVDLYLWTGNNGDPYPPGDVFLSPDSGDSWSLYGGDHTFRTYVAANGPHAGYCAVAGNKNPFTGALLPAGKFLELELGQPAVDPSYTGATPAIFVQGTGITCDPPPAGYTKQGKAGASLNVPDGIYDYWAKP
jgi:hypothetical protein